MRHENLVLGLSNSGVLCFAVVDANITVKVGHDLAHNLKDTLRAEIPSLGHVLIHIEPNH